LNLSPGTSISEKDIGELLHVSRTPVREAFIKLAHEGALDVIPQKGSYVSLIDPEQVEEVRFCRESLEKEIIRLACTSFPREDLFKLQSILTLQALCIHEKNYAQFFELDEEMHGAIFAGCKKSRIWAMMQQMNTHYNRVRMLNLVFGFDWALLLQQHQQIYEAICEQDGEKGLQVTTIHLNKVTIDLKQLQNQFGDFFRKQPSYTAGLA
jgi:DNA-binding GntR family transcriptional regulator